MNQEMHVPAEVLEKLMTLDQELLENDLTIKGCCKKKWALLQQYVTIEISTNVEKIQKLMINGEMDENEGYSNILDILKIENISVLQTKTSQNKPILFSTENLPTNYKNLSIPGTSNIIKKEFIKQKHTNLLIKKTELNNINKRKIKNIVTMPNKKLKTNINSTKNKSMEVAQSQSKRCDICQQQIDDSKILFYNGHPSGAVDEFVALTDPKLMIFTGEENEIHNFDERPHNKITHFSIYDKEGHLCPFDSGLIEKNILLYFSGYIKPIYDDDSSPLNGIAAKDLGPINEWWISGFDGGQKALLGFSTAYSEYYLMDPSDEYKPLMKSIYEKMYLSKIIIEFLLINKIQNPSYEDLLNHVQDCTFADKNITRITEETVLKHAQFICDQVTSFDSSADDDETRLITISCMRALVKFAGVTFTEKQTTRQIEIKIPSFKKKRKAKYNIFIKATTTSLVRTVFESFFPEQINTSMEQLCQRKRCGVCASCRQPDCGQCIVCKSQAAHGKQICIQRRCPNLAVQVASDSESDDFEFDMSSTIHQSLTSSKKILHLVKWTSVPVNLILNKTFYKSAVIGDDIHVKSGDFVMLHSEKLDNLLPIAKIINLYEENEGGKMFHANMFCRGIHTILGEASDPNEIFLLDECETCPLGSIVCKTNVHFRVSNNDLQTTNNLNTYFYQKQYNRKFGRFEDVLNDEKLSASNNELCAKCERKSLQLQFEKPVFKDGVVFHRNESYKAGTTVYLPPRTFEFKTTSIVVPSKNPQLNIVIDEDIYTEFYRKRNENVPTVGGDSNDISEPFSIGYIQRILSSEEIIEIKVQKLYRPENTHKGIVLSQKLDLNLVFWSDEQQIIPFDKVVGKCYLAYADVLDISTEEWSKQGPNRFYFTQKYNSKTQEFLPVDGTCSSIGKQRKSKNLNKGKSKIRNDSRIEEPPFWPKLDKPLRTMDVFAGCGGLSEGLHQSGVAETKWAIENEKTAAEAFKLNNPESLVYNENCNHILSLAISGASHTEHGQPLPSPGDVELLVGGPPCQGFSGMNRFNAGQYSLFKNSLLVSYLSFCDFYRPKYFLLENVQNFAVLKKGIILKLTLKCLLAMGYQCTFGILQAACYGVPQKRRRLIILAAAPGEFLPHFPEPLHVIDKKGRATQLDIVLDNSRYSTGLKWLQIGAPYRTITVRDAMSDLPTITNGCKVQETSYMNKPLSHFQRLLRGLDDQILRDHICKEMVPIVEARMSYVPLSNGSDWRDLPNIVVQLSDGTYTNKLHYKYNDKKNGKNSKGQLRGVCSCAEKKTCDPSDRQCNTLIPWCLPHTANRHNQWVGLYGRLEWDGLFATTVTNPEPMGHQGRVLHPVQHRVVSIRECARSQGFPDKYRFYGNILDKHRQVGNAVPPPMGAAIGREILQAVLKTKNVNIKQHTYDCD